MSWRRAALLWACVLAFLLLGNQALADSGSGTLLFPSATARAEREASRTADQLERSLLLLPDVTAARVQLELPAHDTQPLDEPPPVARLSVVLQLAGPGPSDDDVRRLASGAVRPPLEPAIVIVRAPKTLTRAAHETTAQVGPFTVLARSAGLLRATLATCLLANVCLATLLLLERKRRGRRYQKN